MLDPAIQDLLAIALAAIFAGSAAAKFADPDLFEGAVANYRLLPGWLEKPVAWAVPLCETACAAGILFAATRAAAAAAMAMLLGVFTGAIAINLARGRRAIDCGCFGPALRQELGGSLLVRNLALVAAALALELPVGARGLEPVDFVTIGCGAAMLIMLYLSANYAIANAPRTRALGTL
ncbi:MAG TPA: MauE/DoxX family redox-associated membrane protein [Candidatus Binataceae bacterium]|nr:MauE/DoxX family redox-associated membrane protein [Candidatus Binataceae bacterium]